jgi:hypothetical protein
MWEPRRLIALWAMTACYRDSFSSVQHVDLMLSEDGQLIETCKGGEWSPSLPAALLPGKEPSVPVGQEVGCAPVLDWTTWSEKNS